MGGRQAIGNWGWAIGSGLISTGNGSDRLSPNAYHLFLIHISLIPFFTLQLRDVFGSLLIRFAAGLLDHLVQGGINVLGHALGVATDINMRSLLEPGPHIPCVFQHAMLHVDLLDLIAGECRLQARQSPVGERSLKFFAVEEIGGAMLIAEEKPVPVAPTARRSSRNARNGATPVPGPIMIMGVSPSGGRNWPDVWTKIGPESPAGALSQKRRATPFGAAKRVVTHHRNGEVDLA